MAVSSLYSTICPLLRVSNFSSIATKPKVSVLSLPSSRSTLKALKPSRPSTLMVFAAPEVLDVEETSDDESESPTLEDEGSEAPGSSPLSLAWPLRPKRKILPSYLALSLAWDPIVFGLDAPWVGLVGRTQRCKLTTKDLGFFVLVKEIVSWKKGTKITFPEKGNQEMGMGPGDLVFVVDEKPHAVFKRNGSDLVVNRRISLLEALIGKTLDLLTLDGRKIIVPVTDIVRPGHEVVIPNEGMPISKEPGKKGNLRIKFDVKFPSKLTEEQKSDLKRVLGGSF